MKFTVAALILSLSFSFGFSQETKPKVALVLGGGGAKGYAHLPTLEAMDSLGIKPDLIVGTSIGSIVGALYALGYSGKDILAKTKNINWNQMMGGKVELSQVGVEEKKEFGRYPAVFALGNKIINGNNYLINDQKIMEFFNELCFGAGNIRNFDDLPIPFRAVTTDILNGKEVVLDKGNLAMAIRASMSIPGVFEPVSYNNTLLIDGGILNNFPADIAKSMGADIIIGSDVGYGMTPRDKLNSIPNILFQASMLTSNLKNDKNRKTCDILIENTPNLTYSTADFNQWETFYNEGKIAVTKNMDALVALSEKLKTYEKRPVSKVNLIDSVTVDSLVFLNISRPNLFLAKYRMGLEKDSTYTADDLTLATNRVLGTTVFKKLSYEVEKYDDNKTILKVTGYESSKHLLKGAVHYNSYQGVGILANYTGRNILGIATRTLLTLDIAEQPKFRIQHQKNYGYKRNWWWAAELYGQQVSQNLMLQGEKADKLKNKSLTFDFQLNYNINSLKNYVGIGAFSNIYQIKPNLNPDINPSLFNLRKYNYSFSEAYVQYQYNNLNSVLFPTSGRRISARLSRQLYNKLNFEPLEEIDGLKSKTNKITRFSVEYLENLPITRNSTIRFGAAAGFIFEDKLAANHSDFTAYGFGGKFLLGGNWPSPQINTITVAGLRNSEVMANQFLKLSALWQYNLKGNLYVSPHLETALVGFNKFSKYRKEAFKFNGDWDDLIGSGLLVSSGITLSYNSFAGPIDLDFSWVNDINKFRVFLGIGFEIP